MSEHTTEPPFQLSSGTARYWCHQCGRENPIYMAPDPTCQRCNSQFIEEIDDGGDDPRNFLSGVTMEAGDNDNDDDDFGGWENDMFQSFRRSLGGSNSSSNGGGVTRTRIRLSSDANGGNSEGETPMDAMLQNILSNLLSSGIGNDQEDMHNIGDDDDDDGDNDDDDDVNDGDDDIVSALERRRRHRQRLQRRTPMVFYRSLVDGNMQVTPLTIANNSVEGRQGDRLFPNGSSGGGDDDDDDTEDDNRNTRQGVGNNLQGILQLISTLTGASMVGNPNDYVSSQAALDNIITQLMEQTGSGSAAPPPASEDVISGLPKRAISEKEFIEDQIDCAVCKDDFNISELVIELPCQHVFHDDCIKPWLKVNGTCPVCRHSVAPPTTSANQEQEGNDHHETSSSSSSDVGDYSIQSTNRDPHGPFETDSLSPRYLNSRYPSSTTATPNGTASTTPSAPASAWLSRPASSSPWSSSIPRMFPQASDSTYRSLRTPSRQQGQSNTDPVDVDIELD
ncbi:hypothetical protein BCR42DRAFT_416099 [Absidia repens]|uniref:RING-type E3 ubiquitin transferase n=1 Tax=Absidia repens TaxID=90262 RepID=A0A1X2IGD5_9FUNG|nr:hypothetical protein BCR42DRAFT_416099 [Absidia repens]